MTASASSEDLVECVHRLRLLDLRDHARRRAAVADDLLELADVLGPPDERERHVVDAEAERELEVDAVLLGERRDRDLDTAREVHSFVRVHLAADDDLAERPAVVDRLDREADQPVVDQEVVARLEHLGDRRGSDHEVALGALADARHVDRRPGGEDARAFELGDPELRALEVGDQRERAAELGLHRRG